MTFADWLEAQPMDTGWTRIDHGKPPYSGRLPVLPSYYVYPATEQTDPLALWNLFRLDDYIVSSAVSGPGYFLIPRKETV